jgi:hypothetical protein
VRERAKLLNSDSKVTGFGNGSSYFFKKIGRVTQASFLAPRTEKPRKRETEKPNRETVGATSKEHKYEAAAQ